MTTAYKLVLGDDLVSSYIGQVCFDGSPLTYAVGTTVDDSSPGTPRSDSIVAGIYLYRDEAAATCRRDFCNVSRAARDLPLLHVVAVEYDETDVLWRGWPRSAPLEIAVSSRDVVSEIT
jgi:hypothetical protein